MPSFLSFSKGVLAVISFFAIAAMPIQVEAFTFFVDTTVDSSTPCSLTPAPPGSCSLRGAVIAANANPGPDRIMFARPGTHILTLTSGTNDEDYGDLDFTDSDFTTIIGLSQHDTVIDGASLDRAIDVSAGAKVRMRNASIQHGIATNGGAVFNEGILNLTMMNIDTNAATNGGAVYSAGTTFINQSIITNGVATTYGGGIYNEGRVDIKDSQILGNASGSGAGIYNDAGTVTIKKGTSITSNTAGSYGGAIRNYNGGTVDISEGTIISSNTAATGGAISENSSTTRVLDSTIDSNTATDSGGGINILYGQVDLINSTVSNNTSGSSGGGIYQTVYSNHLSIDHSTFEGNTAQYGGAVYVGSDAHIRNSDFVRNETTLYAGYGGAIVVYGEATNNFTLADSVIEANTSDGGGGGISLVTKGTSSIDSTIIRNNTAASHAGGVWARAVNAETTIIDSTIDGNSAASGGGISTDYAGAIVENTIIDSNVATTSGGAIVNDAYLELHDSTLSNNEAQIYLGGGVLNRGTLEVTNSIFSANTSSSSNGGAIDAYSGTVTIYGDSQFTNNTADSGGAINVWSGATVTVEDTAFIGNSSIDFGGAIMNKGQFSGNNLAILNSESWKGGAIAIGNSSTTDIENTTISGNSAEWRGAGVYAEASSATLNLSYVTIADNVLSHALATRTSFGAGVYNPYTSGATTLNMLATVIADNYTSDGKDSDYSGFHTSIGYNVIKDSNEISNTTAHATDLWGQDPLLAALVIDATPYKSTHALQAGSPAIDIDPTCVVSVDQRYSARPSGAVCDSGAYEF